MDLFCFAGELRQVFANLVGNAIDACTVGGRLTVRARRSRNWKNPDQTGVRFAVADTGTGMEPEVRERAFEAFFTTKEVTGTGLGLWVSHEIIVKHHGMVHLRSRTAARRQALAELSSRSSSPTIPRWRLPPGRRPQSRFKGKAGIVWAGNYTRCTAI